MSNQAINAEKQLKIKSKFPDLSEYNLVFWLSKEDLGKYLEHIPIPKTYVV